MINYSAIFPPPPLLFHFLFANMKACIITKESPRQSSPFSFQGTPGQDQDRIRFGDLTPGQDQDRSKHHDISPRQDQDRSKCHDTSPRQDQDSSCIADLIPGQDQDWIGYHYRARIRHHNLPPRQDQYQL